MTTAHLDYDALADLAEGLLADDKATSAKQHLTGCVDCRSRAAELAEVSRVLAEAPFPPMPADLVERLDAALAAEAASHAPKRRPPRGLMLIAAAAAAAVVIGGGGLLARGLLSNNSSSTASGTDEVHAPSGDQPPAAPQTPHPTAAQNYKVISSGTHYTSASLPTQVAGTLIHGASAHPMEAQKRAVPAEGLEGCVSTIARGQRPLLVDQASYNGASATVIVLPAKAAKRVTVWIVGPGCNVVRHIQIGL